MLRFSAFAFVLLGLSGFAVSAEAAPRRAPATPEYRLVQSVLLLKSLGLSDQDLHREVETVLKSYDVRAPKEGRDERLSRAFVDLRVLSPQQARPFLEGAREAETALAGQELDTPETRARALQTQLELFARVNPVGAQFNSCALGIGLAVAGVLAVVTGADIESENPTCHPDLTTSYACQVPECHICKSGDGPGPGGPNECCTTIWTTCHPNVCDQPGYYPRRQEGRNIKIVGGVAAAVGLVLMFTTSYCI